MKIIISTFIALLFCKNDMCAQSFTNNFQNVPIVQTFPSNRDTIEQRNPTFSWLKPLSSQANNLNYKFVMVELIGNQSNEEAISVNTPIFEIENLSSTFLVYPGFAYPLQPGKTYVWQVMAKYKAISDESIIERNCVSEPWSFTISISQMNKEDIPLLVPYTDILSCDPSGIYWSINNMIKIQYRSDGKTGQIYWQIFDDQIKPREMGKGILEALTYENFYDLSLLDLKPFRHMKTYQIVLTCPGNRKVSYRFKYIKPE